MNGPQKLVVAIGTLAIIGSLVFPPWLYSYDAPGSSIVYRSAGYHSLIAPPIPGDREALIKLFGIIEYTSDRPSRGGLPVGVVQMNWFSYQIDQTKLTVEVLAILALAVGLWLVLRRSSS